MFRPLHQGFDDGIREAKRLKADVDDRSVYVRLYMEATEVGGDGTRASGATIEKVYTAREGFVVKDITMKQEFELVNSRVDGHRPSFFETELGRVTIYGDREGDDAGVYTRAELSIRKGYILPVVLVAQ